MHSRAHKENPEPRQKVCFYGNSVKDGVFSPLPQCTAVMQGAALVWGPASSHLPASALKAALPRGSLLHLLRTVRVDNVRVCVCACV